MYQIGAAPLVFVTAAAVAAGLLIPALAAPAVVLVVGNVSGAIGEVAMSGAAGIGEVGAYLASVLHENSPVVARLVDVTPPTRPEKETS